MYLCLTFLFYERPPHPEIGKKRNVKLNTDMNEHRQGPKAQDGSEPRPHLAGSNRDVQAS